MTLPLHTVKSYHSPLLVGTSKKRGVRYKTRPSQLLALPISALALQTDDEGPGAATACRDQSRNPLFRQANTVGVIGGASVFTTLVFLEKLVWWSTRNGQQCVPFVICSDPSFTQDLPSLASFHSCQTGILNREAAIKNMRNKKVFLQKSGARCIVMPCHLLQAWEDEISGGSSLPFLTLARCVALELKEAKLKPIETESNVRIGVVAKQATLTAGVYQEKLQEQGFEVVLPDKPTAEHILIPAIEAFHRGDMEGARNLLRIAIQLLLIRAVNLVILASDEIQCLLPHDDPLLQKCINPMDALAKSTVTWAKSATNVR